MPILAAGNPGLLAIVPTLFLGGSLLAWSGVLGRLARGRPLLPPPRPARVPWRAGSILLVVVTYVLVIQVVTTAHGRITGRHGRPGAAAAARTGSPWTPRDLLVINAAIQGVMIAAIPLVLRATCGARLSDLGFGVAGLPRNLLRGLIACVLVAPGCYLLMLILSRYWPASEHPLVEMLRGDGNEMVLAVVTAVVLAPVFEELMFRGLLLGWMATAVESRGGEETAELEPEPEPSGPDAPFRLAFRGRARPGPLLRALPAVATSFLFALMHWEQGPAPVPLFLLALVLAGLARRTGSLWASIALHASFNALSILLLFASLSAGAEPSRNSTSPAPATWFAQIFARNSQEIGIWADSCLAASGPWVRLRGVPPDRVWVARWSDLRGPRRAESLNMLVLPGRYGREPAPGGWWGDPLRIVPDGC